MPDDLLLVSAVRLRVAVDGNLAIDSDTDRLVATVGAAFATWVVRAESWLDAWTGSIRQSVTTAGTPYLHAAVRGEDGSLVGIGVGGGSHPIVFRSQRWALPEEVEASFAAASAELDLPLANAVLRRSRVQFHPAEYRLCVIDACSATEIALATALTAHLTTRGLTDAETERLLRLGPGIAEAFPLYSQLVASGRSAVSRRRVLDQLANPRNRAVHVGEHPDPAVAERALDTARLVVEEAVPLPPPDEIARLARAILRRRRAHPRDTPETP